MWRTCALVLTAIGTYSSFVVFLAAIVLASLGVLAPSSFSQWNCVQWLLTAAGSAAVALCGTWVLFRMRKQHRKPLCPGTPVIIEQSALRLVYVSCILSVLFCFGTFSASLCVFLYPHNQLALDFCRAGVFGMIATGPVGMSTGVFANHHAHAWRTQCSPLCTPMLSTMTRLEMQSAI